jgi:SWIM zinc finger
MRTDLLELSPSILTALANAGLVKRAIKEVEQGKFAEPITADDGTVKIEVDDGSVVTFAPGSGINGTCTCGASGLCRHRIGAVLRYQQYTSSELSSAESAESADTASADATLLPFVSDAALLLAVPDKTVAVARRTFTRGFLAVVYPADTSDLGDPQACVVELGTTTVRFLLGSDLRYARCDCLKRTGCEHVALAVWAVREALARIEALARTGGSDAKDESIMPSEIVVSVGPSSVAGSLVAVQTSDVAIEIRRFISTIFDRGLAEIGPGLLLHHSAVQRVAQPSGSVWLNELIARFPGLQAAIEHRSALDVRSDLLFTVASLLARLRYQSHFTDSPRRASAALPIPIAVVIGTDERDKSEIAQLRLIGGGATVTKGPAGACEVRILLADPASSTLLLAAKTFRPVIDANTVPNIGIAPVSQTSFLTGPSVAIRALVKGASITAAATGSVVSNGAVRKPNRSVEFRSTGLRQTSAVGGGANIARFRDAGLVTTPTEFISLTRSRAPRLLRPMLVTEDVIVVAFTELLGAEFDAAQQCVRVYGKSGDDDVILESLYSDMTPGAPAALAGFAAELSQLDDFSTSSFVVGHASVRHGTLLVQPTLLGGRTVVAPALVDPSDVQRQALKDLPIAESDSSNYLTVLIQSSLDMCADLLVDGTRDTSRWQKRATRLGKELRDRGLAAMAEALNTLSNALYQLHGADSDSRLIEAWSDFAFMALTAAERFSSG